MACFDRHDLNRPDWEILQSGWAVPASRGIVMVVHRFDRFALHHRECAQAILDICASNARHFMLFGRRFVVIAQSDDPTLSFEPVGSTPVLWNRREALDRERGL